jgi:D-amino-acid oxidase
MKIIVIGGGVVGLTTAICLLESNHTVTIYAEKFSPHTTSNVAAAFWYPSHKTPRLAAWCLESLETLRSLSKLPSSGVSLTSLYELDTEDGDRSYLSLAGDLEPIRSKFPSPWNSVWRVTVPKIDVAVYMTYLVNRFLEAGGKLEQRFIQSLDKIPNADVIVNCTGLGSHRLANDKAVHPIRGQIICVKKPNISEDIIYAHHDTLPTYIVPRSQDCLLGGTYQADNWDETVDTQIAKEILERAAHLIPQLQRVEILEHKVGLRPGRSEVRLEAETLNEQRIIHNYGHGSIGHTLAWGCARNVARML